MTTPINDFQDILDAIRQKPALRDELRRHLLGEELLRLPDRFAQLLEEFAQFRAEFVEFVRLTQENHALTNMRLEKLETDVAEMKTDVAELKTDMTEVKSDVAELKIDMTEVKSAIAIIGGHVSRLIGQDYESHAARLAPRRVRRRMELENVTVVNRPPQGNPSFLTETADRSDANHTITGAQAEDLELADLVLSGVGPKGEYRYVLAEISVTVQNSDVDCAKRRAAVLEQATGVATIPAAIGEAITGDTAAYAEEQGVTFITIERPRE